MKPKKNLKVLLKNKIITLTSKEYKAAGGFGTVYCLGNTAYKIYHDPKNMIPEAKVLELSDLNQDNILSPLEPLYDVVQKTPIGFTMKYVDGVEFLCKIFTKTFRDDKNISPSDVADLVLHMQKTLQYIHKKGFLVIDYNEMNFLLSKDLKTVFHIDVDAWKTKNFPATALMDSVRDRLVTKGQFTELSDWFSWAVVTFQMYIGSHPYKGFHNQYKPREWMKRMDDGVSVFDSGAKPLPDICRDLSVIPKKHLEWYKAVFKNNERSIPPLPDKVLVVAAVARSVTSKGAFIVKEICEVYERIQNIFFLDGNRFIVTSKAIYDRKNNKVVTFNKPVKSTTVGMCEVFGEDPVVVYFKDLKVKCCDLNNSLISETQAEDIMGSNGVFYTINNGCLIENYFEKMRKTTLLSKVVCHVTSSYKVFRGVVVQDDFMKIHLAIPFKRGHCINSYIRELEGKRIVDARYDKGICIIVTEKGGSYLKYILCFNDSHSSYTIKEEQMLDYYPVNFIVLPNKLCLSVNDDRLSLFKANRGSIDLTDIPFDVSMRLYNDNMLVLFVDDKKLYSVSMS